MSMLFCLPLLLVIAMAYRIGKQRVRLWRAVVYPIIAAAILAAGVTVLIYGFHFGAIITGAGVGALAAIAFFPTILLCAAIGTWLGYKSGGES